MCWVQLSRPPPPCFPLLALWVTKLGPESKAVISIWYMGARWNRVLSLAIYHTRTDVPRVISGTPDHSFKQTKAWLPTSPVLGSREAFYVDPRGGHSPDLAWGICVSWERNTMKNPGHQVALIESRLQKQWCSAPRVSFWSSWIKGPLTAPQQLIYWPTCTVLQ